MTRESKALRLAVIAVALAEALAIALAFVRPEGLAVWLVGGMTMPLLWTAAELMRRDKATLRFSVAGAAALIALALAVSLARALGLVDTAGGAFALRAYGIACGLIIVAYGNIVPKQLAGCDVAAGDPGRGQAVRRYSGWVFVLAGLTNAAIWGFAPIERAALWSMAPLAAGLLLVASRIIRTYRSARSQA